MEGLPQRPIRPSLQPFSIPQSGQYPQQQTDLTNLNQPPAFISPQDLKQKSPVQPSPYLISPSLQNTRPQFQPTPSLTPFSQPDSFSRPSFWPIDPNQRPMNPNFRPMDPNQRPTLNNIRPEFNPINRPQFNPTIRPEFNSNPMNPIQRPGFNPNQRPINIRPVDPNINSNIPNFNPILRPFSPNMRPVNQDPNYNAENHQRPQFIPSNALNVPNNDQLQPLPQGSVRPSVPMFTAQDINPIPQFGNTIPNNNIPALQNNIPLTPDLHRTGQDLPYSGRMDDMQSKFSNLEVRAPQHMSFNILTSPPLPHEISETRVTSTLPCTLSVTQSPQSNCESTFARSTLKSIPSTSSLLSKSKLPFALLISPFKSPDIFDKTEIPVVNPETIVRCRRCRCYINPWIQFSENGAHWRCNLCFLSNDTPQFFDWDSETKTAVNRMARSELTHSVIEFIAPQEYLIKPPSANIFVFVIDVSYNSVSCGILEATCKSILKALSNIANADGRSKVGFIGVDSSLHFFNLSATLSEPSILVCSDLDDVYLPLPYDLLAPILECRNGNLYSKEELTAIETLLMKLPSIFKHTTDSKCSLAKALLFSHKLMQPVGGKLIVLLATLPTDLDGALKNRDDPKIYSTPKESSALHSAHPFYKTISMDFSRAQISVDMFLFGSQYVDVATLSNCPKFTAGTVYYHPSFNIPRIEEYDKFEREMVDLLTRPLGLEAVLRIRASKALPNVSPDHTCAVELSIEEQLVGSLACFQIALLHTNSNGERRVRVTNYAVPITNQLSDVFSAADPFSIAAFLAKKAVERVHTSKLEDAREALVNKLIDILSAYKNNFTTQAQSNQLLISDNLKHLAPLILGLIKHESFRQFNSTRLDLRSYNLICLYTYSTDLIINMIYPRLYALHTLDIKTPSPSPLNLSSEKLDRNGLYLLDAGLNIYFYITKAVHPALCKDIFGIPFESLVSGKWLGNVQTVNDYTKYIASFIDRIMVKPGVIPTFYIIRETDVGSRSLFFPHFVEDKIGESMSYPLFLGYLRDSVK